MFRRLTTIVFTFGLLLATSANAGQSRTFAAPEVAKIVFSTPGWYGLCERDAIDDRKSCSIQRGSLHVTLIRHKTSTSVLVFIIHGTSSFPGRDNAVRVDTLPPHTVKTESYWSGPQAQRIIAQLREGQTARTRFIAWPYGNAIDEQIPLDGFPAAWHALQQAIKQP